MRARAEFIYDSEAHDAFPRDDSPFGPTPKSPSDLCGLRGLAVNSGSDSRERYCRAIQGQVETRPLKGRRLQEKPLVMP